MSSKTNALKQLYRILKAASEADGGKTSVAVWADLLGADPNNYPDVTQKMSCFLTLFDDARSDIEKLDIEAKESQIDNLNAIQGRLFSKGVLSGKWGEVKGVIRMELLPTLSICGDLIVKEFGGLKVIPSEQVEEYIEKVRGLIDEFYKSTDLNQEAKTILINELKNVESALINYQVTGSTGVDKVTKRSAGSLLMFFWDDIPESAKEATKQCMSLIFGLSSVVGVYKNLSPLLLKGVERITEILTLPPT
ncbi:MAG: hypothetical protein AAGG51_06535 [Cyanobacteria bacterium P01_G01_bin.54]